MVAMANPTDRSRARNEDGGSIFSVSTCSITPNTISSRRCPRVTCIDWLRGWIPLSLISRANRFYRGIPLRM
jgi:hypothetical protein